MGGGGGGGGPDIPNVEVRSLTDIANEAVSANIGNLPRLLQAFQQYGPQYAQAINDIFAQSQARLRELYPEQYRVLDPLSRGIASNLGFINDASTTGIPEPILARSRDLIRAGQAARGIAESPVSALTEATELAGVGEQFRSNVTNEGLQFMGLNPLMAPGSLQSFDTLGLTPISNTSLFEGGQRLEPLRIQNAYDRFALEQEQYNARRAQRGNTGQMIGAGVGGIGGFIVGGPVGAYYGAQIGSQLGQAGGTYF